MKQIKPIDYVRIDIANNYGKDKEIWKNRTQWVKANDTILECLDIDADNPILYRKAVRAYRKIQAGEPINHPVSLDATWSGGQIMAVLMRCEKTAIACNLIDNGKRNDVYTVVMNQMNNKFNMSNTRQNIKDVLMPFFYNSNAKPKEVFGNGTPEHKAFLLTIQNDLPGASKVKNIIQSCWNPDVLNHDWYRPDGTFVKCPVMGKEKKRIKCGSSSFTHIANVNKPSDEGLSLPANLIQSLDGMVMARMVSMAKEKGYELYGIHDSFFCHPNNMQQTRENYLNILVDMAESPILTNWYNSMMGTTQHVDIPQNEIDSFVEKLKTAEYALS